MLLKDLKDVEVSADMGVFIVYKGLDVYTSEDCTLDLSFLPEVMLNSEVFKIKECHEYLEIVLK